MDTGETPGPQINVLFFDSPTSVFLATLGASQNLDRYYAHWRREDPIPIVVDTNSVDVGPRSLGQHTVRIGRRLNGRLEFWLDGILKHTTGPNVFPSSFNYVYLVGHGTQLGQIATFTDYQEGIGAGPGDCATDVSGRVRIQSSGLRWIPYSTWDYIGSLQFTNISSQPIPSPYLVTDGLQAVGKGIVGTYQLTFCRSSEGSYLIPILPPGDVLQPGQSVGFPLLFVSRDPFGFNYTTRVFSGLPSR